MSKWWTILINALVVVALVPFCYWVSVEWYLWKIERAIQLKGWTVNETAELVQDGPGYNPANSYFVIPYDCRHADVVITGTVPRARYWSIFAYDRYTMPLASYWFDETVQQDALGRYTVYLTTSPSGRANEMNVAAAPRGLVIIRTSFPADPTAAKQPPTVQAVSRL